MTEYTLDLTFNQCGKNLGTTVHPLLNLFIRDLRKFSKGDNFTDKCPTKGRVDKIQNFEISTMYLPTMLMRDKEKLQFNIISTGQIVGEGKMKPIYSWKIVVEVCA